MEPTRVLRLTAIGGVVLVAIMASRALGTPALVLMIGPGIAVPLGLSIAIEHEPRPYHPLIRALSILAPFGAAAGILGWLFPPGDRLAILCASIHALVCFLAALLALVRFLRRRAQRFGPLHEFAHDLGLGLLAVAAIWFFASRAAMPLIGFQEPVVTFTAAHFHFAGFAAPTIIGGVGRLLLGGVPGPPPNPQASSRIRRLYQIAATAICAGIPLTAIGIATNHTIEATAAVLLASGMLCASALIVFVASRTAAQHSKLAALLFVVSGSTLLLTMTLAATFALTSSAGRGSSLHGVVPLQIMIDYHGLANAVGFSLSGLTALALTTPLRLRTSLADAEAQRR
jgi:hypothetical protein